MNNTFATSPTIGEQRDIAPYRAAAAGLAIPTYLRGINSSVWQSALHRSGQRGRACVNPRACCIPVVAPPEPPPVHPLADVA